MNTIKSKSAVKAAFVAAAMLATPAAILGVSVPSASASAGQATALAALASLGAPRAAGVAHAASSDLGSQLNDGQTMTANQFLHSPNGQYQLWMQGDGNLVEYRNGKALWDPTNPGTAGHPGAYAVLQGDGNFVVYPPGWYAWSSTTQGNSGDHLNLQDDGNLVIYSASGSPLWATMTGDAPQGYAASGDPYPNGQCTYWVDEAARSYRGTYLYGYLQNARYWAQNAPKSGYEVGNTPRIGSVAIFQPGTAGAGSDGHVAWVTEVYPDQDAIQVTEMNYQAWAQVDTRTIPGAFNNSKISYLYLNP
jgi:surface antigen